jgi:hypothetical protein
MHFVARGQQVLGQDAANVAGAAGDQDFHARLVDRFAGQGTGVAESGPATSMDAL